MIICETERAALHCGAHHSFVAKQIAIAVLTEQTLLVNYHLAVTRFLKSCGPATDNFIGGEEDLRLREAWHACEQYLYLSTPPEQTRAGNTQSV